MSAQSPIVSGESTWPGLGAFEAMSIDTGSFRNSKAVFAKLLPVRATWTWGTWSIFSDEGHAETIQLTTVLVIQGASAHGRRPPV